MTTQPISPSAASAREAARHADGKFGTFVLAEADVDLEPGGYLPVDHTDGNGFADFCAGCGDPLTGHGECVACEGPFEESFTHGGKRYGLVVNGEDVVIETSQYRLVDSFRPHALGLADEEQIKAHAMRLVEQADGE